MSAPFFFVIVLFLLSIRATISLIGIMFETQEAWPLTSIGACLLLCLFTGMWINNSCQQLEKYYKHQEALKVKLFENKPFIQDGSKLIQIEQDRNIQEGESVIKTFYSENSACGIWWPCHTTYELKDK